MLLDEFDLTDMVNEERKLREFEQNEKPDDTMLSCANCGAMLDIKKQDDSGYIGDKPYCESCRLELLDWM